MGQHGIRSNGQLSAASDNTEPAGLKLFIGAEDLIVKGAEQFCNDFTIMWPSVEDVTPERVLLINWAPKTSQVQLPYRLLKPVVHEACYQLASGSMTATTLSVSLRQIVAVADRMMEGCEELMPSIPTNRDITAGTVGDDAEEDSEEDSVM